LLCVVQIHFPNQPAQHIVTDFSRSRQAEQLVSLGPESNQPKLFLNPVGLSDFFTRFAS
jgi:hypothetical protein